MASGVISPCFTTSLCQKWARARFRGFILFSLFRSRERLVGTPAGYSPPHLKKTYFSKMDFHIFNKFRMWTRRWKIINQKRTLETTWCLSWSFATYGSLDSSNSMLTKRALRFSQPSHHETPERNRRFKRVTITTIHFNYCVHLYGNHF